MKSERKKGEAKNLNPDSLLPDGALVAKPFLVNGPRLSCPCPFSGLHLLVSSQAVTGHTVEMVTSTRAWKTVTALTLAT